MPKDNEDTFVNVSDYIPDWSQRWTAAQAEEQLQGFKFEGPGWYVTGEDVMLVYPTLASVGERSTWQKSWPKSWVFCFAVWNGRHPAQAFNAIVNAPTRKEQ